MTVTAIDTSVVSLSIINGQPITTSQQVAQVFAKEHHKVLRDIRKLTADLPEDFTESNFGLSEYKDRTGRTLPVYNITRDGFTLLAMGFTGKRAIQFKLAYILAFNQMEKRLFEDKQAILANPRQCLTPEQQRHIQELVNRIQHQQGTHWNTTYHNIKTRFQVGSYKDVRTEDYPSLCRFLGGQPLEGEWMPKQSNSAKPYSFPASLIRPSNAVGNTGWLTLDELNKSERPLGDLLNQLETDGHDVGGAKLEYLGMQKLLASSRRQLDAIGGLINDARLYGLNVTLGDGSVNTSGYIDHQGRG